MVKGKAVGLALHVVLSYCLASIGKIKEGRRFWGMRRAKGMIVPGITGGAAGYEKRAL